MKLIITRDDCRQSPVDYIEHSIRIDCSDVPNEWMYIFTQITQQRLQNMQDVQAQMRILADNFVAIFEHYFAASLTRQNASTTPEMRLPKYQIRLKKGFTCSERMYGQFLLSMNRYKTVITKNTGRSTSPEDATSSTETNEAKNVATKPILIEVIIEESHGTKILPRTGHIRLDAKATAADILSLLDKEAMNVLEITKQYQAEQDLLQRYHDEIAAVLGIAVLDKMAGIDEEKYLHALQGIHRYLESKNGSLSRFVMSTTTSQSEQKAQEEGDTEKNKKQKAFNRGVFRHIEGMKVMIGYYCGIRDDGACLIPWNIPFQKLS
jgi:hypothetical protein